MLTISQNKKRTQLEKKEDVQMYGEAKIDIISRKSKIDHNAFNSVFNIENIIGGQLCLQLSDGSVHRFEIASVPKLEWSKLFDF